MDWMTPLGYVIGFGTVESVGKVLFTEYLFPFEVVSLLLLAAMVGVIVLAKRNTG